MTSDDRARPVAYLTLGGAGSGKSTLSRHLSALTGAAYLDKDTLAGPLVRVALDALGQDPSDRESNTAYLEKVMPAEYEALFAVAGRNLELGHSVVIDAPFVAYLEDAEFLRRSTENAQWPDARVVIITVQTSRDVVRQRLVARGSDRDQVKLAEWDTYWERFGTLRCRWTTGEHVSFPNDTESDLARLSDLVRDR